MGFQEPIYTKRFRLKRDLANEFISVRQFLNGNHEFDKLDNDQLRTLIINRAIDYSFKQDHGLLKTLSELCDHSRLNGAVVDVNIQVKNWEHLVLLLGRIKSWGKLDELDLVEEVLRSYIAEIKVKGCLP